VKRCDLVFAPSRAVIDSSLSREEAIHKYLHLVKYVAGRILVNLPASVDINDLINDGVFGLMDAIEKYDRSRTVKFETYAITRINGAIIDALRSMDWVPRTIRHRAREVDRAYERLELELGRTPSREELAGRLRLTAGDLDRLLQRVHARSIVPLEAANALLDDEGDVTADLEREELRAELVRAVDALLPQERVVIRGYYFGGETLKQIKTVLGVSESRVSQIHAQAVRRLRQRLRG
jgi:RNA polymerase sigma factor for flagellar operon FliA